MTALSTTRAAFLALLLGAWPARAWAWGSAEHQEIGRTAYFDACAEIAAHVASLDAIPPDTSERLEIACGRNRPEQARIYGDATAIAGDFLDEPSEFFSQAGAWRFRSRKSYWLLALENDAHFNPMATQSWARFHGAAITHALAAAKGDGLAIVAAYQLTIQESAFADHFLQDSFAAGHMGFNRTASSAAAAKRFHDDWNARGRIVRDRNGSRWVTFGDGRLNDPHNADARRQVLLAATASVRGVLRAFVTGERSPDEELAVWRMLPFAIEAPELNVDVVEIFEGKDAAPPELVPLVTAIRPARKDTVVTATTWSSAPFSHADAAIVAAVAGVELAVPGIPLQAHLGAGATLRQPHAPRGAVLETGVLVPLGVSLRTLLSHQLHATAAWLVRDDPVTLVRGEYRLSAELGDVLVNLHAGLVESFPGLDFGWFGGVGLGFVFSAAGGGTF